MDRAIGVTWAAGWIYLPTGLLLAGVLAYERGQMADGSGPAGPWAWVRCAVIIAISGAMLFVARRMRQDGIVAYASAATLSVAVVVVIYAGSVGLVGAIIRSVSFDTLRGLSLPIRIVGWVLLWWYAYLIYGTCAALPDAWERHRALRRERLYQRRGFEPVMAAVPVPTPPVATPQTNVARIPVLVAAVPTASVVEGSSAGRRPFYRPRLMERAVRAVTVTGSLYVLLGMFVAGAEVADAIWGSRASTSHGPSVVPAVVVVFLGGLLLALGWRMRRDEPWAYFVAAGLAILLLVLNCISTVAILPLLAGTACVGVAVPWILVGTVAYLAYGCLTALPDARDLHRTRRREQLIQRRGFAPILSATPVQPVPPPPTRIPPRPGAPSRPKP